MDRMTEDMAAIIGILLGCIVGGLIGLVIIDELQLKELKTKNKELEMSNSICTIEKATIKEVGLMKEEMAIRGCRKTIDTLLENDEEKGLK